MIDIFRCKCLRALMALTLVALAGGRGLAAPTAARLWNEQLLHAISLDTARPTVHARNLFYLSAGMYDAWAAYDATAKQYGLIDKQTAPNIEAARNEAISFAAYRIIQHRFVTGPGGVGPGKAATAADIRQQMIDLGYDPDNATTVGTTPAALGNRIAQALINRGLNDGAREQQNYITAAGQFVAVNQPLTFDNPGTTMVDPNRWQPLHFLGGRTDQFGTPINEATQRHLTPFWGAVTPFAMNAADRSPNGVYHDQGAPPKLNSPDEAKFKSDAVFVIQLSSYLTPNDGATMDISPVSRGNAPNAPFTESYDQVGYALNPVTGQPYQPQIVARGDFYRLIAEFWADGPRSTAPPGHWNEIRNDVTDKMELLGVAKRIGGAGPVVSDLEWDVKSMFALNGGLHDAAIAAWNHKGIYDSARPISMIRYMGQLGQSSDPGLTIDLGGGNMFNTYHPDGLPLVPDLIEVVTPATTAPGQKHAQLAGSEGKIAVLSWQGAIDGVRPFDDPSEIAGVDWILAENWMPYQLISFVTPPFAGYVSGHSTYSRTGAEVLTLLTGSEFFPGGIFEYDIPMGSGLDFEYGPVANMKLQFATYYDASDQASLSRISGGIHPPMDDFTGRRIGNIVGPDAWARAQQYFAGVPEPASFLSALVGAAACGGMLRRSAARSGRHVDISQL